MRKIQLDLADLKIESFSVDGVVKERGTVHGRDFTQLTCLGTCRDYTCACSGADSCSGDVACLCDTQDTCLKC